MKTEIVTMTPEMAAALLAANTANRTMRAGHVAHLVGQIKRGEWRLTHQGVAVSSAGVLLDGQHRLQAIVNSGIAVKIMLTTDVDNDAFSVIDDGMKRSMSDRTGIDRHRTEVASVLHGIASRGGDLSADQIVPYDDRFGPIVDQLVKMCSKKVRVLSSASVRAAVVLRCAIHEDKAHALLEQYRAMVLSDVLELWPSVAALYKQAQTVKMQRTESFFRAAKAFNPAAKNLTKIQLNDPQVQWDEYSELIRKAIK